MEHVLAHTLITGAGGMVGSYVDFGQKTNRLSLDVTDEAQVNAMVMLFKPRAIIHLAAATDMEKCQADNFYANSINVMGTKNVAIAAKECGAKLVYVSTNAVFDGNKSGPYLESDTPNPQESYGSSKYSGEVVIKNILKDYLIVRTSWVFGGGSEKDKKFVGKIIQQLMSNKSFEVRAIADRYGTPTFAKDLISAIKEFLVRNLKGLVHVANSGCCSRYDMAVEIASFFGGKTKIVPVGRDYFGSSANQLSNECLASAFYKMRPWQEALREYLITEWV